MRMGFQANYRGKVITVHLSCDYSLWTWRPVTGQAILCAHDGIVEWIGRHAVEDHVTRHLVRLFSTFCPPPRGGYQGLTGWRKSKPAERQEPSLSRKNAQEGHQ